MADVGSDPLLRTDYPYPAPQYLVDLIAPRDLPLIKLVLDFDGTITTDDTLHLVAQAGYDARKKNPRKRPTTPWENMVVAYMADYSHHLEQYRPEKEARKTVRQEMQWLDSLANIEKASADRVYNAGVWDDVTLKDIETTVEDSLTSGSLRLRRGIFDLLEYVTDNNPPSLHDHMIEIVSVNWSRWFIWKTLTLGNQKQEKPGRMSMSKIRIYSNEIPSIEDQLRREQWTQTMPGGEAATLRTSVDKAKYTDPLLEGLNDTVRMIYIGDSPTDLQGLLKVDIGICIRDRPMRSSQKELADICERTRIPVRHINDCGHFKTVTKRWDDERPPRLWWVHNYEEIIDWLRLWSGS